MNKYSLSKSFIKFILNTHLWIIILIFLICLAFHYSDQIFFLKKIRLTSLLGLERHAIERILFIAPITYAAFIFGLKGGIITLITAFIIMMPRVILFSNYPRDSFFETCIAVGIGIMINWWLESWRKEIGKREQVIIKLENARKEQKNYKKV